jgi:hypothetical protein
MRLASWLDRRRKWNPEPRRKFHGIRQWTWALERCARQFEYNGERLPIKGGGYMAEPSYEELKARLAELEKQTPGRRTGQLDFRVGEKGGVSVYGLGRFPVTLYYEQWIRLLDTAKELREFLEGNKAEGKLKLKDKAAGV